jgi:hypothetical protein
MRKFELHPVDWRIPDPARLRIFIFEWRYALPFQPLRRKDLRRQDGPSPAGGPLHQQEHFRANRISVRVKEMR